MPTMAHDNDVQMKSSSCPLLVHLVPNLNEGRLRRNPKLADHDVGDITEHVTLSDGKCSRSSREPSKLTETRNSSQKEVALANRWHMPRRLIAKTRTIVKIPSDARQLAVLFREISLKKLQEAEVHRMPTMAHDSDVQMKSNSCSAIRNTSTKREHNALMKSRAAAAHTVISVLSVRALSQVNRACCSCHGGRCNRHGGRSAEGIMLVLQLLRWNTREPKQVVVCID